jgi:hypothetical protein
VNVTENVQLFERPSEDGQSSSVSAYSGLDNSMLSMLRGVAPTFVTVTVSVLDVGGS